MHWLSAQMSRRTQVLWSPLRAASSMTAEAYLAELEAARPEIDLGLDKSRALLERVGNPHKVQPLLARVQPCHRVQGKTSRAAQHLSFGGVRFRAEWGFGQSSTSSAVQRWARSNPRAPARHASLARQRDARTTPRRAFGDRDDRGRHRRLPRHRCHRQHSIQHPRPGHALSARVFTRIPGGVKEGCR